MRTYAGRTVAPQHEPGGLSRPTRERRLGRSAVGAGALCTTRTVSRATLAGLRVKGWPAIEKKVLGPISHGWLPIGASSLAREIAQPSGGKAVKARRADSGHLSACQTTLPG